MKKVALLRALAGGLFAVMFAQVSLAQYGSSATKMVYPDQGWSQEDRLRWYYTSQGSAAISYDIFLNLEVAKGQELFRGDKNMGSYGFAPQPADPKYNPDGLPHGLTKTSILDGRWKGDWMGPTCAACHDLQLEYKGTTIKVSGGNNKNVDFYALIQGLDDALAATAADPKKFDRLAEKLGQRDPASRQALRKRLDENAAAVHTYNTVTGLTPAVAGPGRVDALGLIHNQVMSRWLGVPQNWKAPLAPTKPSYVWNLPQSAWAQWSGVLFDPLLRNVGESMGVFVRMDLTSKTPEEGLFENTMDIKGQLALEDLLRRLAPPQWPEEVLGKIDREKAAKGSQLFKENCAGCHSTWPHRWSEPKKEGKRFIENAIVTLSVIGTDPGQFASPQFESRPTMNAGPLSALLEPPNTGDAVAPPPAIFRLIQRRLYDSAIAKLSLSDQQLVSAHGYRPFYPEPLEPMPAVPAHKANPAEGMWSAPPYLHNGSVPNLYELLLPAAQRSKKFYIGTEFDPVKLGVDTSKGSGKYLFDTSQVGNSNAGHSFENGPRGSGVIGRLLTDDERWALIEYMKSIPDQPAQISPFGGPKDPIRAWEDKTFYHVKNPGTYNGAPQLLPSPTGAATNAPSGGSQTTPALGMETPELNEKEFIDKVNRSTLERLNKQFPPGTRPVLRDAHPKTHGLVSAEFVVLDGLPDALRYGVFKTPGKFTALIRFSAGGIEVHPDNVRGGGGMAIKLLGVPGEKILAAEKDADTQDFVMINAPTFMVRNLADYELLHQAIDAGDQMAFFRGRPEEAKAIRAITDAPFNNPLQVRYFSQTPYKLGPNAMKYSAKPISRIGNQAPETMGPDFLREAMIKQLKTEDVYFEFLIQLQNDPVKMPVEDSLTLWDETQSPFRRVAIIRIPKQDIDAPGRQAIAENLAFNPWHSLPEQRPLGSINRSRRVIYEDVSEFRRKANGAATAEPTAIPW